MLKLEEILLTPISVILPRKAYATTHLADYPDVLHSEERWNQGALEIHTGFLQTESVLGSMCILQYEDLFNGS